MRLIVFSDLDGTLLNHHDYRYEPAVPVLQRLRDSGVPLILVSSKTRPEIEAIREELGNTDPFVCENGGVIAVPRRTVGLDSYVEKVSCRELDIYYRGLRRAELIGLVEPLQEDFRFRAFSDMTVDEVVECTGLDRESAARAARREASEPLLWHDTDEALERLAGQLRVGGVRAVRGGRFVHVMGDTDKAVAVKDLIGAYAHHYGETVHAIALGDSPNDRDMLLTVDTPVVIPRPDGRHMRIPKRQDIVYAEHPGAQGWAEVVTNLLDHLQARNGGMENQ